MSVSSFPTRDEILQSAVAYFQVAHRNPVTGTAPPMGPRTWTGGQARALADLISDTLSDVQKVDDDAIPGTYLDPTTGVTRTRNSSLSLENWAYVLGLPSSVPGVFGRRGARASKGGAAVADGTPGVVIATLAQLTDLSGKIVIRVQTGITIDADPTKNGIVLAAVTTGLRSNLPINTILRWSSPPPGLKPTLTLTAPLILGDDIESDVTLALRIINHLQAPLHGGTAADYRFFAENAEDTSGVLIPIDRAYPLAGRNGTGTVDLCITQPGSGSGRDPGATVASQVLTWVEAYRPISDGGVRIVRPYFDATQVLSVTLRILPATGYPMDWDDSQGTASATTSTSSTGKSLIIDTVNPPSPLKTALDGNNKPRIQLSLTGYAIPFVARVLTYTANTPSGKCTLNLDTDLTVNPGAGVSVYAGGPAVLPVAAAVLAYINSVGPSRASGYAPSADVWSDAVTVAEIANAAILTTDSAGQRVCVTSPNVGDITVPSTVKPGVLIKVGSGSFTSADFRLYDNDLSHGPQLPEVGAILVHRGGV